MSVSEYDPELVSDLNTARQLPDPEIGPHAGGSPQGRPDAVDRHPADVREPSGSASTAASSRSTSDSRSGRFLPPRSVIRPVAPTTSWSRRI